MHKFHPLLLVLIAVLFLLPQTPAKATNNLDWPKVGRACLPEEGRMLTNRNAACHCPPKSLCPNNASEWNSHPRQPDFISDICCERPKGCNVNIRRTTSCGRNSSYSERDVPFCLRYEAVAPEGHSEDESYQKDLEEREELVGELEACLAVCEVKFADLLVNRGSSSEYSRLQSCVNSCESRNKTARALRDETIACAYEPTLKVCTTTVSPACRTNGDCLAVGTEITLADGSRKPIEAVAPGDVLRGYTSDNTVLGVSLNQSERQTLFAINGTALTLTQGHPVLTQSGWKAISPAAVAASENFTRQVTALAVGDLIVMEDGKTVAVTTIAPVPASEAAQQYNIAVDGDRTFIGNGTVLRAYSGTVNY